MRNVTLQRGNQLYSGIYHVLEQEYNRAKQMCKYEYNNKMTTYKF